MLPLIVVVRRRDSGKVVARRVAAALQHRNIERWLFPKRYLCPEEPSASTPRCWTGELPDSSALLAANDPAEIGPTYYPYGPPTVLRIKACFPGY